MHLNRVDVSIKKKMCAGTWREPIVRQELCRHSRREASLGSHPVVLQTLQRPGTVSTRSEHRVRRQSQPGHMFTGPGKKIAMDRCDTCIELCLFTTLFGFSGHRRSRPIHCLCRHEVPPTRQVCVSQGLR